MTDHPKGADHSEMRDRTMGINKLLIVGLLLSALSGCRPVLTIGWQEIAFVVLLVLLLLGPPLYRLTRRLIDFQKWRESLKDQEK